MKVWWSPEPVEDWCSELLDAVTQAHYLNTFRPNQSAVAIELTASGSGNLMQALAAATLTLGGQHGPVMAAYDLLMAEHPGSVARVKLSCGRRVPGWGNAYIKDRIDPAWDRVVELLKKDPIWAQVEAVQAVMEPKGLFPNPACLSAATAIVLKMPRHLSPWVGGMGRFTAWAQLFMKFYKEPVT